MRMKKTILVVAAAALLVLLTVWGPAPLRADEFCYGRLVPQGDGTAKNPCYQPRCYRGTSGQGEVIKWVKTERECRYRSVGQSWGHSGHYTNFSKDVFPR